MAKKPMPKKNAAQRSENFKSKNKTRKKKFPKGKDKDELSSNLPAHDTRGDNDISYWNKAGQLYVDATTIPTFSALGAKHISPLYNVDYYSPTGIARFDYAPFFGDIRSSVHPINTTAKIIYNAINSKNSRYPSYDPSDLMIYIIAVAQAWSVHAWIRRLVGMFNTFSVINRYWWEPICTSMGVAPISTDNDIVTWRNLANHIALILDRLPVPKGISYFERSAWMNMNIYMDQPIGKSTYYYFNPAAVLKYDYGNDQVGQLVSVETPWHQALNDPDAPIVTPHIVESFFMSLVANLFNDSDIPVIGSDIMKAFDGNIYGVGQIDSSFVLSPMYSPEVNLELHNARVHYGAALLFDSVGSPYTISQDMTSNSLVSSHVDWNMPAVVSTAFAATDLKSGRAIACDFPIDNPSNDDWMIATRLLWCASHPDASHSSDYAEISACTELLIDDDMYEFTTDANGNWSLDGLSQCATIGMDSYSSTQVKLAFNKLSRVSKLHDTPITFVIRRADSSAQYLDPLSMHIVDDLSNYCTISVENLRNMHDVAQISVFLPDWLSGTISGK